MGLVRVEIEPIMAGSKMSWTYAHGNYWPFPLSLVDQDPSRASIVAVTGDRFSDLFSRHYCKISRDLT